MQLEIAKKFTKTPILKVQGHLKSGLRLSATVFTLHKITAVK